MKTAQRKTFRGLVKSYHAYGLSYTIHQAPLDSYLVAGSTLSVRIEAPQFLKMAIVNEGQWHYLTKKAGIFTGSAKVQPGTAKVSALLPGKGESYWGILEYVVDEKTAARAGIPGDQSASAQIASASRAPNAWTREIPSLAPFIFDCMAVSPAVDRREPLICPPGWKLNIVTLPLEQAIRSDSP